MAFFDELATSFTVDELSPWARKIVLDHEAHVGRVRARRDAQGTRRPPPPFSRM